MLCASASAQEDSAGAPPPSLVTAAVVEAKIQEVEATTGLEEEAKTKLVELYRKALSHLQAAAANTQAAEGFQKAAKTAPVEIQVLREQREDADVAAPEESLEADPSTPLRQLEQLLQKEKADLAAVDARRADAEKRLEEEARRPVLIRERLTQAKQEQEAVALQLKLPAPADEGPTTVEAKRWELETRYQALSTEIQMLDQELLSQPVRVDLLKAQRDKATASVTWIGRRIKRLEELVTRKRQDEADQAKTQAETTRQAAEGKHPLVIRLAEQNAVVSEEMASTASRLDELAEQTQLANKLAGQVEEDFTSAKETIAIGGLSQELGQMLLQQRQSLPDLSTFRRQAEVREDKAARIGVQRLRHRQEQKRLRDLEAYVVGITVAAAAEEAPLLREQLHALAVERRAILEKAVETDNVYLRKLGELETAQQRLLEAIETYDAFLSEHLLWVRSASRAELEALGALPEQVWRMLSPTGWLEVTRALLHQVTHSPAFVLLAVALGVLLWGRRRMIAAIQGMAGQLGKPTTDRFTYSVQAVALTLIAAAAWPLVVAVTGWQLKVSVETTDFSNAVGGSLIAIAAQFYYLRAFRTICLPGGLAAAHFRWPEVSLRLLRSEINRLTWLYLPAAMVTIVAFHLDPLNAGWIIGRAAFLIMAGALAFAFYRLLAPKSGVLAGYIGKPARRGFRRLHRIWYPLLVVVPLALGVLSVMGYVYTAGTLLALLLETSWMVVSLVILAALAQRWLLVARRRLAYQAAMERRQALSEDARGQEKPHADDETGPIEVEEPEVDLGELSDTGHQLLNTVVIFSGFIGLWMIWAEVFPALHLLNEFTLWHSTVSVDGVDTRIPVTLVDIGMALIYGVATVILAKQLPAVLEMILLEHFSLPAGSRYTFTTLTSYVIVSVGILLVLNTIGAQWSQLQWLVAALSVGIGFGLQEIVANFISGIILLFERPIRIGDVVTVGTTDGVVTKIRIRATTIRNWDRKELLVPNKQFITGEIMNWSLSDQTTRIVIIVGVAYGSDVDKAHALMREAAEENENVLNDPKPVVSFEGFGVDSLTLLLRAYIGDLDHRVPTTTALHKAINQKFIDAGIVIAFPQRDLHLDLREPLRVNIADTRQEKPDGGANGHGDSRYPEK